MLTRGSSALLWRKELGDRDCGLAFFAATGLPLIVAIVSIGEERGAIDPGVGASLVGAGCSPSSSTRSSRSGSSAARTRETEGEELGDFAKEFLG